MRLAIVLIGLPLIMYIFTHGYYMGWHLPDPAWLQHAKNHLVRAMFGGVGLGLVGLIITFIPFRKGERWAWWALFVIGFFGFGGFWFSYYIAEFTLESERQKAVIVNALSLVLYSSGLAIAWRRCS